MQRADLPHKIFTLFTCPTEEELLSGRAPPGDEGVLEEVVNLAVRGVANALQSADVEYMGALKETGKLVAKTVILYMLFVFLSYSTAIFGCVMASIQFNAKKYIFPVHCCLFNF